MSIIVKPLPEEPRMDTGLGSRITGSSAATFDFPESAFVLFNFTTKLKS